MRFFALFCLLSTVAVPTYAADPDLDVTSVEIWVHAVDSSGKFVPILGADDFEIYEDGRLMTATCFDVIESNQNSGEFKGKERLAIYVDLFNITPPEYARLQKPLADFVRGIDTNKWEVFLAVLNSDGKLGIIGPDVDAAKLAGFLERAAGNAARDSEFREHRRELLLLLDDLAAPRYASIEQVSDTPTTTSLTGAYRLAGNFAKEEKTIGELSLAALESLGKAIEKKTNNGHTTILYISGGFNVDPGRTDYELIDATLEKLGQNIESSHTMISNPDSNRESNFDLDQLFVRVAGKLNRANVTTYTLNTRGNLRGDQISTFNTTQYRDPMLLEDYQDSLARIALETGGTIFEDSNNFDEGLRQVAYDISNKYVLCYEPPKHDRENGYHMIEVVSKQGGLTLRYRQGYVD